MFPLISDQRFRRLNLSFRLLIQLFSVTFSTVIRELLVCCYRSLCIAVQCSDLSSPSGVYVCVCMCVLVLFPLFFLVFLGVPFFVLYLSFSKITYSLLSV